MPFVLHRPHRPQQRHRALPITAVSQQRGLQPTWMAQKSWFGMAAEAGAPTRVEQRTRFIRVASTDGWLSPRVATCVASTWRPSCIPDGAVSERMLRTDESSRRQQVAAAAAEATCSASAPSSSARRGDGSSAALGAGALSIQCLIVAQKTGENTRSLDQIEKQHQDRSPVGQQRREVVRGEQRVRVLCNRNCSSRSRACMEDHQGIDCSQEISCPRCLRSHLRPKRSFLLDRHHPGELRCLL